MFGFIKNLFKHKKRFEEIKAERKAVREKLETLEKKELAYVACEELGKINIKDPDADEQIVYCFDKIYESGVIDAIEAAAWYITSSVLWRDDKLADKIMKRWTQTKSYKLIIIERKIAEMKEDF